MSHELSIVWAHGAWTRLGLTVAFGLLLALILRHAAYVVLGRFDHSHPLVADVMRRASAPMEWLMPLLTLNLAMQILPTDTLAIFALLRHLLLLALLAAATWLAVRCIGVIEDAAIRRHPMDISDNLRARQIATQARVLGRTADILVIVLGAALMLLTIPGVRQLGASLLASAGVAGLAIGLAAKPVLGNLIAGLQIALAQPIRLDDVVIIEGEWGRIEEITGTYVVVRIWDERRLVVPLGWFIENPFQNWTRRSAQLVGTVFLVLDYRVPLAPLRDELRRLCGEAAEWDGRVCVLQMTDATEHGIQLRALVSSADSGRNWDLRCRIREGLIAYVQSNHPQSLPRLRGELERGNNESPEDGPRARHAPEPQHSPSAEDEGPLRSPGERHSLRRGVNESRANAGPARPARD